MGAIQNRSSGRSGVGPSCRGRCFRLLISLADDLEVLLHFEISRIQLGPLDQDWLGFDEVAGGKKCNGQPSHAKLIAATGLIAGFQVRTCGDPVFLVGQASTSYDTPQSFAVWHVLRQPVHLSERFVPVSLLDVELHQLAMQSD
jgi:hypothetical protein